MCGLCGDIRSDGSAPDVDRYALDRDPSRAFVADHLRAAGAETAVDAALRLDSEVDFPVPAITHLDGKVFDLVRDALSGSAARKRALFRPEYVARLLAEPDGELTPLRGNKLWQLGLLELWLQENDL